jgi:hypothetical protein
MIVGSVIAIEGTRRGERRESGAARRYVKTGAGPLIIAVRHRGTPLRRVIVVG